MTVNTKKFLDFSALTHAFYTSFQNGISKKPILFQKIPFFNYLKIHDHFLEKNLREELTIAALELKPSGFEDLLNGFFRVADVVNKLFTEFKRYEPLFKGEDDHYENCERHLAFSCCSGRLLEIAKLLSAQISGKQKKIVDESIHEFREFISETNKKIVKKLDQEKEVELPIKEVIKENPQAKNNKNSKAKACALRKIFQELLNFFTKIAKFLSCDKRKN